MWPQTHTHSHSAGCLEHESERKKETEEVGGGTEEEKLTYCFISVIHFESGLNQEALGGFFTITVWLKRPINWSKKLDRRHKTMNMLQWNIYTHSSKFCIWYKFLALLSWFAISPDSRWQTANQAAAQRQTELETCADRLGSFASAASQLGPWLREKELMMSVLGPLSIDPNMLNTQKQQVQVCDRRITEILPKGTAVINTHTEKMSMRRNASKKTMMMKMTNV